MWGINCCYTGTRTHLPVSFPQITTVSIENIVPIGCIISWRHACYCHHSLLWHNFVHVTLTPLYCQAARRCIPSTPVTWPVEVPGVVWTSTKSQILLGRPLAKRLHNLLHQAFEWFPKRTWRLSPVSCFVPAKLSVVVDLFSERQQLSKKFESLLEGMEILVLKLA